MKAYTENPRESFVHTIHIW